jgi:hypothetical protein
MPFAACRPSASDRPSRLGVKFSAATASSTRARVGAATRPGSRSARDTVAIDTPARSATA